MNIMTKENFWNEIKKRWHSEFNMFGEWIDDYKQRTDCYILFSIGIKFHDLPDEMQLGIFIKYTKETPHRFDFVIDEGETFEKIIENVKEWFCEEQSWAENEHQIGKYIDDYEIDFPEHEDHEGL